MPIYEYECSACKHRFERSQRFSDAPLTECPECGSAVRRVLFPAGIVFKGSGWYATDSRSTPSESSSSSATDSAKSDGAAKSESKGESGSASKSESGAAASTASTASTAGATSASKS